MPLEIPAMSSLALAMFCITVVPLILTPGPDILYITTRGIAQGRFAALISTLGVCAGYLVHTALAVAGLTALLYASEFLFELVRYVGAAYLVYLGIKAWRDRTSFAAVSSDAPRPTARLFFTGMATSVLNPKGILLFFAYFPQFVSPQAGNVPQQLLFIGILFTVLCGLVYGTYAFFSAAIGRRLKAMPRFADCMRWLTASVLVGLGLRLLVQDRQTN
jgi:threonine/homoserine/homoserine lactone efflux protein